MLVGVVIPCYNNAAHVGAAVDSVLAQSHGEIEVLVVDDGSTDASGEVLARYRTDDRVRLLAHADGLNRGVSHTRRLGVDASRAPYIAFLDADDEALPGRIAAQVDALERAPTAILCHSAVENIYDRPEDAATFAHDFAPFAESRVYRLPEQSYWLDCCLICNSSVMVRREALVRRMRPFDQVFQYEDWLLWLRLGLDGPFSFLAERLGRYRYHPSSATAAVLRRRARHAYSSIEALTNLFLQLDDDERSRYADQLGVRIRKLLGSLPEAYGANTADGRAFDQLLNSSRKYSIRWPWSRTTS